MNLKQILFFACFVIFSFISFQSDSQIVNVDSTSSQADTSFRHEKDLIDYAMIALGKNYMARNPGNDFKSKRLYFSLAPIVEYTLSTGFATGAAGNVAFVTNKTATNVSAFVASLKYTQYHQILFPIASSVWSKDNKYNWLGDWRILKYPQETYGFGGHSSVADGYIVNYKYIRFYQAALKKLFTNFYAGAGYQLDYHWNISEENVAAGRITDFEKYGFHNSSVSSGVGFVFQYDSRKNSINPEGGSAYCKVDLLQNFTFLGSNTNWNSITIDARKYFKISQQNVLALWSYNVFTLSGNPPYLDLPGTGTDTYNNTGRGYIEDRFIGKNMIDFEAEFRYNITRNGFLGGVIFGNAESLPELQTNRFEVISPAAGIGFRFKFNKFSKTNACLDYAVGVNGSHGFFGNLGENF